MQEFSRRDMQEFYGLIRNLSEGRGAWQKGKNLALLHLEPAEVEVLKRGVISGLWFRDNDFDSGRWLPDDVEHAAWGAGMLLVGARAFQSDAVESYKYRVIGVHLGFNLDSYPLEDRDRDAMERGARGFWGIPVLRDRTGRRLFRTTMVLHSGGSPKLLLALCERVDDWDALEDRSDQGFQTWIRRVQEQLGAMHKLDLRALTSEEGRGAMVQRLKDLAALRGELIDSRLVCDTLAETSKAIRSSHGSIAGALDLEDEELASEILKTMFDFSSGYAPGQALRRFGLCWSLLGGGAGRVVVCLPQEILPEQVPPNTERCRLSIVGAAAGQQKPVYVRKGSVLSRVSDQFQLPLPTRTAFPLTIVAECRTESGIEEVPVFQVELHRDVLVFDQQSGKPVRVLPEAGKRVALVAAPGLSFGDSWGRAVELTSGLHARVGTVPPEPVELDVMDSHGRRGMLLAPAAQPLEPSLSGDEIVEARCGRARVFTDIPEVHVEGAIGATNLTLTAPDGTTTRWTQRARVARPAPIAHAALGKYVLTIENQGRICRKEFFMAPYLSLEAGPLGEKATLEARLGREPLGIHCLAPDAHGTGRLELAITEPTTLELDVPLPENAGGETLRWHVRKLPRIAFLADSELGKPTTERQIARLRTIGGGVVVFGQPGTTFTLSVLGQSWTQLIGSEGSRFFPLAAIPPELFEEENRVTALVSWTGHTQEIGPIEDESGLRPEYLVGLEDSSTTIALELSRPYDGEVTLEAIPAWQPWREPFRAPTALNQSGDRTWYEARANLGDGPWMVSLFAGDHRLSGLRLVPLGDCLPPDDLDSLERTLWGPVPPTREECARLFAERLANDTTIVPGLFRNFKRNGARWFRLIGALAGSLTQWRLLSFLVTRVEEKDATCDTILHVFDEARIPWCLVRLSDWDEIGQILAMQPIESLRVAMQELASLRSGLLVPGSRALVPAFAGLPPEEFLRFLQPYATLAGIPPRLSTEQVNRLRSPDAPLEDGAKEPIGLRYEAMLEARRVEMSIVHLDRERWWRDLTASWTPSLRDDWDAKYYDALAGTTELIIHRLRDIERGVIGMSWRVHKWRNVTQEMVREGKDVGLDFDVLRQTTQLFPLLYDYWLNWFASMNW